MVFSIIYRLSPSLFVSGCFKSSWIYGFAAPKEGAFGTGTGHAWIRSLSMAVGDGIR